MSDHTAKSENANGQESFEHQDLKPAGVFYFMLALLVITVLCLLGLRGLYAFLDQRSRAQQPPVNPLVTHVPADTRNVPSGYPQSVFPNPKLEEDERGQLNDITLHDERILYSYGWVDEKSGTVRIPIERAMDLIVQRGLPVGPQSGKDESPAAAAPTGEKGKKK
jgi:hypothetical protein